MIKNLRLTITMLSLVFCLTAAAFGQETTGTIEITVRDAAGAVVPNVPVTVESVTGTTGFKRTVTTNDEGFQRILQVPPGEYKVSAGATGGFAAKSLDNINVVLGKITPVNFDLSVTGGTNTVDIVAGEAPIDATDSKIQTNISARDAELLPKGTNFASLLKVSPATRPEPKSGGFQVDGASGSENTFVIDGQEVTNAVTGTLDANNNLPFQLVQEVQVKSSGFEAEYGGATGGVINVVTKGGNNALSGEFGAQFRPGVLQPRGRPIQYLGTTLEYINPPREPSLGFFPTATLGGPIVKNRLWFFGSYTPQIFTRQRTIDYRSALNTETYDAYQKNEYAFGRLDAQPFDKLRLTGTYTYNPIIQRGELPGVTTQFESALPSGNGLTGPVYQRQLGGRQNSMNTSFQGAYTPTNNIVITGRYGYNFLNTKLGTYGRLPAVPYQPSTTRILCSAGGLTPPASAGCNRGDSNGITIFSQASFDATKRTTYDVDATYITSFLGRHEFKGGYQFNGISNEVLSADSGYIILRYGRSIDVYTGRAVTPSAPICAAGQTTGCVLGSGSVVRFAAQGKASSENTGVFFQDKWQPTSRLTLNLGIRAEREMVPSFNGAPGIDFDWGSKIAPRIGVAYDLTGDGKTKVSGFYGWFYDRFKYELPRGSFGGNLYYQDYFEIPATSGRFDTFTVNSLLGTTPGVAIGGACPATGFVFGAIRCSIDRRVPSNAPGLDITEAGGVDPDIKAYRQQELTFTFERELSSKFVLAGRYTRKKLDRAIEDVGFITPSGSEAYIIGNPGFGLAKDFLEAQGYYAPKAVRNYDAFEVRLDRRFADNYYFNLNYTYSRLYGNYSGLASSDEEGRTSPNVSRSFDAPFTESSGGGGETLGLLATDRPHVVKFAGAYSLDWAKRFGFSNNTTEFQTFFTAQSGTPLTTFVNLGGYDTVVLNKRGDLGRTKMFTATDFAIRHRYRFGRDNRFTLVGEMDFLNVFNQNNETGRFTLINQTVYDLSDPAYGLVTVAEENTLDHDSLFQLAQRRFQQNGAPGIISDASGAAGRDPRYNLVNSFQSPREVRFGFRLIF